MRKEREGVFEPSEGDLTVPDANRLMWKNEAAHRFLFDWDIVKCKSLRQKITENHNTMGCLPKNEE